MRQALIFSCVAIAAATVAASVAQAAAPEAATHAFASRPIDNQYIVVFKREVVAMWAVRQWGARSGVGPAPPRCA